MRIIPKILAASLIAKIIYDAKSHLGSEQDRQGPAGTPPQPEAGGAGELIKGTVEAEGVSMDYCRFGRGKKHLVILPGLSIQPLKDYAQAVADAYEPLADEFTIYVLDRRNDLPPVYSMEEMGRDTIIAIRALGLNKISIFGASQGAALAMEIAVHSPDLVEKMALGSASVKMTTAQYAVIGGWVRQALEGKAEELCLTFGEEVYPEEVFRQSKDLLVDMAKSVSDEDMRRFAILGATLETFDLTKELADVDCPILILGDKTDRVMGPGSSERIYELLKDKGNCQLYMYDGYGHGAYDLAPDYKQRLLEFFAG